ncbi:MAG: Trk system potassium transporter TrkA [Gemmatimonadetes bacterium]|mgnify:FL=1|jgi:trk system potassium uptake protein TrkA|nr:Trk system potassium transporter TrkA [Gemmatimonadota bacterium]
MRILVIGAGAIGFQLSKQLSQDGHGITLIDIDHRRIKRVGEQLDILVKVGSGTSLKTLQEVDIDSIDLVAAMTTSDEVNLLACRLAKKLGVKSTIARIRNPEFASPDFVFSREELGIDQFIHPEKETADAIVRLIRQSSATDIIEFAEGKLVLLGVRLDEQCPLLNSPLSDVGRQFSHIPMRIVAIQRKQQTVVPSGDTQLYFDDRIFVISDPAYIPDVIKLTGHVEHRLENIMILGGSLTGQFVAQEIAPDSKVKLIESSTEKSWEVADRLKDVLIIQGDGTDYDLLAVEGITDMDAFIAVTGSDEINIISTLIAKHFEVERTISLVNNVDYIPITPAIGMDSVLSKQLLTVNAVQRYVRHQRIASIASLPGLDVEAVEYIAREGSKITKKDLRNIRLPRDSIIGAVVHHDRVIIPDGDTRIEPGDKTVVFTRHHTHEEVRKFFGG